MKKFLLAIPAMAIAAVMAFALAGCGESAPAYEVGQTVEIGTTSDGSPLEWTVLEVDGDKALVIANDEITRSIPYATDENGEAADVSFGDSTVCMWLNGEFLNDGVSSEDQAKIVDTDVDGATVKVFILSQDQLAQYFATDEERADASGGWYWTCTKGSATNKPSMVVVFGDGGFHEFGFETSAPGGVRPAMWITA